MSDGFDDLAEAETSFGPGFDLIVGLLAVVLVALQLSRVSLATALGGDTDLTYVSHSKEAFLRRLCTEAGRTGCAFERDPGAEPARIDMSLPDGRMTRIEVAEIGTNQTLRIGNEVLFESGQATLKPGGRAALERVIRAVWSCRGLLREVQVQGHADRQNLYRHGGNLQLASDRAIVVYREFQRQGVDPRLLLLSAATYDSFKPTDREPGQSYDWSAWEVQSGENLRNNRRVEFHLIYRLAPQAGGINSCQ